MNRPNFFIIGAPKCGTTSLANWLSQHPRVFMSDFKEPHYFNTDDSFRFVHDEKSYLDLFTYAGPEHLAIGEASTWYLFSKTAVPEIEKFTDCTARYIVCLRNPIEVAPALHGQALFSGNETVANFIEAWSLQEARQRGKKLPLLTNAASHLQYRSACALGEQVERLMDTVPRERIHFVFLDDIRADSQAVFDRLISFLGLPQSDVPVELAAQNRAHRPKFFVITRLIHLGSFVRRALGVKHGLGILTRLRNANKVNKPRDSLPAEMHLTLATAFEDDILRLETLLQRDLSHWRKS